MGILFFLCANPPNWFIYASGFASLIAFIFVIFYFIKPSLKITNESTCIEEIRIKCENRNFFRNPIIDIHCDIVASKSDDFNIADTLQLAKNSTPGIRFNDNYIFKVKPTPSNFSEKNYIKVRILAVNVIGIKKMYEKIFDIKSFK